MSAPTSSPSPPRSPAEIIAVRVVDNQKIRRGDELATIDPEPFELVVAEDAASVRAAQAQLAADADAIQEAEDTLSTAGSALALARVTQERMSSLVRNADVSRQQFDQAKDALLRAEAVHAAARVAINRATATRDIHAAGLARAEAALGTARWNLSRTRLVAPGDGTIVNLTLQVGDMAQKDTPLIGIVADDAWRIMANYKQSYLPELRVGQTAWVWLDTYPWHVWRGRVAGIARGISREPTPDRLLPYVAPTTDWIRLQRRFPVTITLVDPPPDLVLHMGANARTVIFP